MSSVLRQVGLPLASICTEPLLCLQRKVKGRRREARVHAAERLRLSTAGRERRAGHRLVKVAFS